MLDQLRQLPPLASCGPVDTPSDLAPAPSSSSKKKSQQQQQQQQQQQSEKDKARRKAKNLIKVEQKASPDYGNSINPISR